MFQVPVIPELFSVIGQHYYYSVVIFARLLQPLDEAADIPVHGGDGSIIQPLQVFLVSGAVCMPLCHLISHDTQVALHDGGVGGMVISGKESGTERFWRLIESMGVHVVQVDEEGAPRITLQPFQGLVGKRLRGESAVERVECIETLVECVIPMHKPVCAERRIHISRRLQPLGESGNVLFQIVIAGCLFFRLQREE